MPLPLDMGGMKVTMALYFLPGGKSTQKIGVEADVRLPIWLILEDIGETALDYPLPAQVDKHHSSVYRETPLPLWNAVETERNQRAGSKIHGPSRQKCEVRRNHQEQ